MSGFASVISSIGSIASSVLPMFAQQQQMSSQANIMQAQQSMSQQQAQYAIALGNQQAAMMQQAAEGQARAMEYNASLARVNAQRLQAATDVDAAQQKRLNLARLGAMRANILKSGVVLSGTPLLLLGEEAEQGELERLRILSEGGAKAADALNEAQFADYNAAITRQTGDIKADMARQQGQYQSYQIGSASYLQGLQYAGQVKAQNTQNMITGIKSGIGGLTQLSTLIGG